MLPRLLVDGTVSPEYDREGALPVCFYLGAVVRAHSCRLDHSYVDGLAGVGEEEVWPLVRLVVVDPYLLLVDHSALLLRHCVVSHPARDRVVAHHSEQMRLAAVDDVVCIHPCTAQHALGA